MHSKRKLCRTNLQFCFHINTLELQSNALPLYASDLLSFWAVGDSLKDDGLPIISVQMYNQLFSILIQFARNTLVFNES